MNFQVSGVGFQEERAGELTPETIHISNSIKRYTIA
jgi:hypothetical protein